jgi:adenylate cyclase
MKPSIQFAKRPDGIKIAYSRFGKGAPLVCPAPWVTSLSHILEDPIAHKFWTQLAQEVEIISYDKHGCGQSDRNRRDFSPDSEILDLETIISLLRLEKFYLLGSSMAGPTALAYAYRNPKKVNKLILYGSYASGHTLAKDDVKSALISLVRASWGLGSKALADIFIPEANPEEIQSFVGFQREGSDAEVAAQLMELTYKLDVTELLSNITTPTLILHREKDKVISLDHGRHLASEIPNANFKLLRGQLHLLWLGDTNEIIEEILGFIDEDRQYGAINISAEQKAIRKLRAILSADVKGYSRLMADDESFTIQTLKAYRKIMAKYIKQYNGRVVDTPGDNILAEFSSAVDAVECSVEIQKVLKKKNEDLSDDKKLEFRIGINIGDVVQDEDRIYGSGVNIAARIEGIAEPGGICISRNCYDHVKNKLELGFEYIGEHEVKNIDEPVRIYKVVPDSETSKPLVRETFGLHDKPSIAVLPFDNISGDPSKEYFSDGLTEEIITGLSKLPHIFVIARNSTFTYKGKAVKVQQVSREMGARYVLEGSVRSAGERVRITAQLIDGITGRHLWADRYDRELKDIFVIQDEITMKIMIALQVKLTEGEQANLQASHTSNLEAYVKYLQARQYFLKFSKEETVLAKQKYQESIALEPGYAPAFAGLAGTYLQEAWHGWSETPEKSLSKAMQYAKKCVALDESRSFAHATLGFTHLVLRQWGNAVEEMEFAVSLNPNDADSVVGLAVVYRSVGRVQEALVMLEKAIRLNPRPPNWYLHEFGSCYRLMGRYEEAIAALKRVLNRSPDYLNSRLNLIVTYIMSGDEKAAREEAVEVLKQRPDFSIKSFLKHFPYKDQKILDGFSIDLRKAGLPD